jgi:alginate O-acetyltransferase complex protein AlgI
MLFNSIEFLIFFIVVYVSYLALPFKGQNILLLIASYIFYGWWDEKFLYLIVLSTVIDFYCGLMIDKGSLTIIERYFPSIFLILASLFFATLKWEYVELNFAKINIKWGEFIPDNFSEWKVFILTFILIIISNFIYPYLKRLSTQKKKQIFILISIFANLGILAFFKYFNFFINSLDNLFQGLEIQGSFSTLNIILPVGISFYTFQTMSYTIDIYRGQLKATNNFLDFALFVSFFPQLVAGPIERASELLPRILSPRILSFQQCTRGLYLILFGLFKKIAIADSIAKSVNSIYETTGQVSSLDIIFATVLFAIQIYCDFSAYSDIARGLAKLFGMELMINFNLPYFSKNPSEFWQRWHISLSTWLRDYLYIPLGGNRRGNVYKNLMITMVLGGLWHGAGWNFVLWGVYQGSLLCLYKMQSQFSLSKKTQKDSYFIFNSVLMTIIFFALTCYGWLLFRADSFSQIANFTQILFTQIPSFSLSIAKPTLAGLIALPILIIYEFCEYFTNNYTFYLKLPSLLRGAFCGLLIFITFMGMSNEPAQFIYFQF